MRFNPFQKDISLCIHPELAKYDYLSYLFFHVIRPLLSHDGAAQEELQY